MLFGYFTLIGVSTGVMAVISHGIEAPAGPLVLAAVKLAMVGFVRRRERRLDPDATS